MSFLPTTFKALTTRPDWEVIITTSQNKRYKDRISIHIGLFNSLWSEAGKMGQNQGEPLSLLMKEVQKGSGLHGITCREIAEWVWEILESKSLRSMRFSTGKYLDNKLNPRYDNCVDLDVSMVLETGSINHLVVLVEKMLGYNRKIKEFYKEIDHDRKRIESEGNDRPYMPPNNAVRKIQGGDNR